MKNFHKPLTRRKVLGGLGVLLSLPWFEYQLSNTSARSEPFRSIDSSVHNSGRLVCFYIPNGVNIFDWIPKNSGLNYILSPTLKLLEAHKDEFTVISGLGHLNSTGGHNGADNWLTGAKLLSSSDNDYSNSISVDQVIANQIGNQTRYPSIQLSDNSGTGAPGHSHTLSFNRHGIPLPAENSPRVLFNRLFVPNTAKDRREAMKIFTTKKSILDNVLDDANSFRSRLNRLDQSKLDQYLNSVRETEKKVQFSKTWIDVPRFKVDRSRLSLNSKPQNPDDRSSWLSVMLELTHLAFLSDSTRVITYEWSREASGYGEYGEDHHELSHHGGDPSMLNKLGAIDRFHIKKLTKFLDLLKSNKEGETNMLDNTIVLFGSGMNSGKRGAHSPKNLPLIVAGGKSLGLKHGKHIAFDRENHPPLSNLHLTITKKLNIKMDAFSDSSGALSELI